MANLRTKTAMWFETTAIVDRMQDDGQLKKVKEVYVVDALSCSEAEARVINELENTTSGELSVVKVQTLPASELTFDNDGAELWYKAKIQFITTDEKTGKERRTSQYMYVQAKDLATARTHIVEVYSDSMLDYNLVALSETNILEVFEHDKEE